MADKNSRRRPGDPDDERDEDQDPSALTLDQEIARKYDPQTLSRLVMRDAGKGEPLDAHTRSQMEARLGGSFANVRVFRGPLAEEITRRYHADAVTVGKTEMVMVREGARSNFQSATGKSLLAHELTHVRQQQRGLHFAGTGQSSATEQEAERVEKRVHAEELGKKGDQEAVKHKAQKEKKFWMAVKMEALRLFHEDQELQSTRDGHGQH
jgi:hypothetical protein